MELEKLHDPRLAHCKEQENEDQKKEERASAASLRCDYTNEAHKYEAATTVFYYDTTSSDFRSWLQRAIVNQEEYVRANNNTLFYEYTNEERHLLLLRICICIHGIHTESNNAVPLLAYTENERKSARKIMQQMVKIAGGKDRKISINCIYLSCVVFTGRGKAATIDKAMEIPLLAVLAENKETRYVDIFVETHNTGEAAVLSIGKRFLGGMLFPRSFAYAKQVKLVYEESKDSSLEDRTNEVVHKGLSGLGTLLSVASLATMMPWGVYATRAVEVIRTVSMVGNSVYASIQLTSTAAKLGELYERGTVDEELVKYSVLMIALSCAAVNDALRAGLRSGGGAATGTIEQSFVDKLKRAIRVSGMASSAISIALNVYRLHQQEERTEADYNNLALSFFALYNVVLPGETMAQMVNTSVIKDLDQLARRFSSSADVEEINEQLKMSQTEEVVMSRPVEHITSLCDFIFGFCEYLYFLEGILQLSLYYLRVCKLSDSPAFECYLSGRVLVKAYCMSHYVRASSELRYEVRRKDTNHEANDSINWIELVNQVRPILDDLFGDTEVT